MFKRKHLRMVLEGRKTQTRRIHKREWTIGKTYAIRDEWFDKPKGHILITRKFKQRLGDITIQDIRKEGYKSLKKFREAWEQIYGEGSWNEDLIFTVYEFRCHQSK